MAKILVINFGSTSTKTAIFEDERELAERSVSYDAKKLAEQYFDVYDQYDMRKKFVMDFIADSGHETADFDAFVVNGGLLPAPVRAGAYGIDQKMIDDLYDRPLNKHPGNFSARLAYELAQERGALAMIYDSATVDERREEYTITGVPEIRRDARAHVLNTRAKAIRLCAEKGWSFREKTLIVVHMGGGTGTTLLVNGVIEDGISDDMLPFSPTRMGGVPGYDLVKFVMQSGMDYPSLMNKFQRESGLTGHLGTHDVREIEKRISGGDTHAELVLRAMCIRIANAVGCMATDAFGRVDAVILTGGMAHSKRVTDMIEQRVRFIAPVYIMPGEEEMSALALGALRVLRGDEKAQVYTGNLVPDY